MSRQSLSKKLRFEVFKRDSFTCQYCGQSAPTVVLNADHIHPVSKGGDTDILNLITACFECNAGKKDRLLSDDTAVAKQKAQLDELNLRREQIEMMLEWRNALKSLDSELVDIAVDAFDSETPGWHTSDSGRKTISKHIKKFGLTAVLDAIDIATSQYLRFYSHGESEGEAEGDSVGIAFSKIGGICKNATLPEWKQELNHIKNIANKQWHYCNQWALLKTITTMYVDKLASLDEIRQAILTSKNWTEGQEQLANLQRREDG